jgi:hypothetical protein
MYRYPDGMIRMASDTGLFEAQVSRSGAVMEGEFIKLTLNNRG